MRISILTLFPEMFQGALNHSILKIAQKKKLVDIDLINIRDFGIGRHRIVDDKPYGGGVGMIMRVDVIDRAISYVKKKSKNSTKQKVVLLDPKGKPFTQKKAVELSKLSHLILVSGRYEGVDERIHKLVDEKISIGDYVLTGGEIPAMVITDSITRLLPGVLKEGVTKSESFSSQTGKTNLYLEYPQYTRPRIYKNLKVPKVLFSGNHKKYLEWKQKQSHNITHRLRPDLLK